MLLTFIFLLGLIILNTFYSFYLFLESGMKVTKKILLLQAIQVFLFMFAHKTLFSYSPSQYNFPSDNINWPVFLAAHLFRALDIADLMESFQIEFTSLKSQGALAGFMLFLMHWTFDFFVFGFVFYRDEKKKFSAISQSVILIFMYLFYYFY